jgi:hypothetical protein
MRETLERRFGKIHENKIYKEKRTMNWPDAVAAIGIAFAIAAIFWAAAWARRHDDCHHDDEPAEWDKEHPFVWTSETKTYAPGTGQQEAKGAEPAKVTPADQVPQPPKRMVNRKMVDPE